MQTLSKLIVLLEGFLVTQDRPPNRGQDIESYIATNFDDDHPLQDLAVDFAQYDSCGGEYLFDNSYMVPKVSTWLRRIRSGEFGDYM
jgi:hypothetical protein